MKTTISLRFIAALLASLFFIGMAHAQETDCEAQGGILITPSAGAVGFLQVTYLFPGASGDGVSATGEVEVYIPTLLSIDEAPSSGYINIVTDRGGWVVQNLPIVPGYYYQYHYEDLSTMFNLNVPDGQLVLSLNATVCYSDQALDEMTSNVFSGFVVTPTEYDAEGQGEGVKVAPNPPPTPGKEFFPDPKAAATSAIEANHENVQTATNQCGPSAAANNIQWLVTKYGIKIPDMNIPGLRDIQNKNSIVGKLDMTMWSCGSENGRQVAGGGVQAGRRSGLPTQSYPQLAGTMLYLANNKLSPTLKHQGLQNFGCPSPKGWIALPFTGAKDVTVAGLTSKGQGTIVDPAFIYNEINNDSAVVYADERHVMSVVGAGTVKGAPYIFYVSDHLQTNRDHKDELGTLDKKGNVKVDASWLCQPNWKKGKPCKPDPTKASPIAIEGPESWVRAVDVLTIHP
jgi:hypothetical protein